MKSRIAVPVLAVVCLASLSAQDAVLELASPPSAGFPTDDMAYRSSHRPKPVRISADMRIKDDPIARREWMKERMGGALTSEFRDALLAEIAAVESAYPNVYKRGAVPAGAPGTWTNIGPVRSNWIENGVRLTKSDTGRVRTIAVDSDNPDIVYLLTSGGGLWKTSNFLSPRPQWEAKSDAISAAGGATALGAMTPTGRSVYLGTGDPFDGGLGGFVVKSVDGGNTWGARKSLGAATTVTDIKVDGNTVFVGTNAGLWRSLDGGETFAAAGPVFLRNAPALAWSIARTNNAWLVTYEAAFQVSPTAVAVIGAIYRSIDTINWVPVIPFSADPAVAIGRTTLAVAEQGDPIAYAYAATINDTAQKDVYRSTNGGATFTALGLDKKEPVNPNDDQPDLNIMAGQAGYNQMLLVDPSDETRNTVYIGGQFSSAKSTDGGQTWRLVSNWLALYGLPYVHADFHAAAFLPQPKSVLVGTDGGLFVSADGGATWDDKKNDGISSFLVYALASNEKHPDDVLIGSQDNGTRLRVGNGSTYNQVFGGDGFGVGWSEGWTMGSVYYSLIFRNGHGTPSTELKWRVGFNGIAEMFDPKTGEQLWPQPDLTQFITTIYQPSRAAAPEGRTFYHRTKYKLYRTTNSGGLWEVVGNFKLPAPTEANPVVPEFRGVTHPIGVGHDNQDEIAVAMSGGNVMISRDGGKTVRVENLNAPRIPGFNTFATAVAWGNPGELYLSTENPNPAAPHLVRTKDAGLTWERLDFRGTDPAKRLPAVPISKILVHPRERNTVFVGTWIGVFVSKDAGATWAPLGQGFPLALVNDLYMPSDGSFLRAASYGRGVWDYRF